MHKTPDRPRRRQQGFTLIELMMTAAIIGVLLSVAVPYMQSYTSARESPRGSSF